MILTKLFDAVILINIFQDLDFKEILINWAKNPRYEQWTSYEVNFEVKKKIYELGINGEYILVPCHNIQANTPEKNVLEMFKSAKEYGSYP